MNNVATHPAMTEHDLVNVTAEQALLGAIMLNNDVWGDVCSILFGSHFATHIHGIIYDMLGHAIEVGAKADPITISQNFDDEELPSHDYLSRLIDAAVGSYNHIDYAKVIRSAALARQARQYCNSWGQEVANLSRLDQIADEMVEVAESIRDTGPRRRKAISGKDAVSGVLNTLKAHIEADRAGAPVLTVKTRLRALDDLLGGLYPGDLIVLAGRPSMGKSALALTIADNVAADGWVVKLDSLEMSAEQNVHRMLSARTGISSLVFRSTTPRLSAGQMQQIADAQAEINTLPIWIDDTASLTVGELSMRAKAHKAKHGLDLLIVDYLQLMAGPEENMVQRISTISRGLKILAKELDIPVIVLSQLSRAVEQRDNKRPQLSDLRDSGAIEQDADIVLFVYREAAYERKKEPHGADDAWIDWKANYDRIKDDAEIIIDKHRQGPTGTARLHFDENTTQFRDRS